MQCLWIHWTLCEKTQSKVTSKRETGLEIELEEPFLLVAHLLVWWDMEICSVGWMWGNRLMQRVIQWITCSHTLTQLVCEIQEVVSPSRDKSLKILDWVTPFSKGCHKHCVGKCNYGRLWLSVHTILLTQDKDTSNNCNT